MILTQLTLRNFCLYRGEQVFNLTTDRRRGKQAPIVLFGGINGGGKTTLLDAVQLVLYGNRARCSKRGDKAYDDFLDESIHHGADPSDGAAIELAFRYAAEGAENLYEVVRSWSKNGNGRIRERVRVSKDGEVDSWLSDNWSQVVEELIPFGIAQLCFFDAEKIRFLAEDETSTQALGDAIKSLLGLDLVERLVADAAVLEGRVTKRVKKSADLQEVHRLEAELDAKQLEIDRLTQDRASLENPRQAAENDLSDAEERFSKIGGQHWQRRQDRRRQLVEQETSVRETQDRLVGLSATELPLMLVTDLLAEVSQQSTQERHAAESGIVSKLLDDRDATLIQEMKRKRLSAKSLEVVSDFLSHDRADRDTQSDVEVRLQLSAAGQRLLAHLLDRELDEKCRLATELLDKVEHGRREAEDLQRGLAAIPEEDAVRQVAEELKTATKELTSLDQQISRLDKQLDTVRHARRELDDQLRKLRRKVVDEQIHGEEDARLANLLVRTQDTMTQFLRRATTSKIDRLSGFITESFRFLLRKKSLVHRVSIDPETFAITLFDDAGQPIDKQRLSEGEKQIFAISVLWGLSRASARPLPAIIDTPMARLDAEHRNHLVERYFPHASHQVIVLSTDTEIERQYFHDLQPHIARAYHLNYDEKRKLTEPEEGYFWDVESITDVPEEVAV